MSAFTPSSRWKSSVARFLWCAASSALLVVPLLARRAEATGGVVPRVVPSRPPITSRFAPRFGIIRASAEASLRLAQSGMQCEEGAPPAGVAACTGKHAGDSCTVTSEEHTFTGQCAPTPLGTLTCRPPLPPTPPTPAVAACDGRQVGDACQITDEDETIAGTCQAFTSGQIACVRNPPPPLPILEACAGKTAGDACTFMDDEDEEDLVNGTCMPLPNHPDVLACVPQPEIPPAVAACTGMQAGGACSFTADDKTIDGNCASLPGRTTLVCLPPPPQILVGACTGKSAGDACTVSVEEHEFTGVCSTAPDGTTLACLPPRATQPPPRLAVCSGKTAGTPCSFQRDDRTISGLCRIDDVGDLACLPPAPPQDALDACVGKAAGDSCSFSWRDQALSGACRDLPDGTTLVCAPVCPPHWVMSSSFVRH